MASEALKCSINVSFSGCGFLGMYHIGVLARLREGQKSNEDPFVIKSALGASAGALAATALMLDLPPMTLKMKLVDMAKEVKSLGIFGPFHPKFDMLQLFQKELTEMLPPDAHVKASNKVHISLTDGTINNVIVSNYSNLDELKDAIICSCYLPGFSSWKQVPNYKNKPYLDGGFSNNQPVLQEDCTLRVSPFSGGSHICPIDGPNEPTWTKWGGEVVNVTKMNAKRFVGAVMPPDDLEKLFEQGYDHTEEFLRSEKFKKFLADLNVPDPTIEAANSESATEVPQENHA